MVDAIKGIIADAIIVLSSNGNEEVLIEGQEKEG
jgi:hypothetical protein